MTNKRVEIYVLNDDRALDGFLSEHGLSLLIKTNGKNILFDAGQTDNYLNNAKKLGLNLDEVDAIVLSHGHYDHGNGLKQFEQTGKKLFMHPNCTTFRNRKSTGTYGGINLNREELCKKLDVIDCKKATKIFDNVYFLGEIERKFDFEGNTFPTTNLDGSDDKVSDDSGVVIETDRGLVVVTGCGHSGICNTIETAKRVTGRGDVLAVVGGFHLRKIDESIEKTINYFKDNNVQTVLMGHCTIDEVCNIFEKEFPSRVKILRSGCRFEL